MHVPTKRWPSATSNTLGSLQSCSGISGRHKEGFYQVRTLQSQLEIKLLSSPRNSFV